jgi:hypothetical protein
MNTGLVAPPEPQQQEEEMEENMHRRQAIMTDEKKACCDDQCSTNAKALSTRKCFNRLKVLIALHSSRFLMLFLVMVIFVALSLGVADNGGPAGGETVKLDGTKSRAAAPNPRKAFPDLSQYENCTIATPAERESWTTKPLWFPAYPNSIDENIVKSIISSMTGLGAGAKSFYASSRQTRLRQCFGKTETASCILIHPMVEMSPGPMAKTNQFASPIVYLLRNPATAMPAFLNGKRIKYAKLPGQTPVNEWRSNRDAFLENGLWEGYKNQLKTWHGYTEGEGAYYKIKMYLVQEHLMDPDRGVATVEQLATVLSDAGFPTAPKEDMGCVWYKGVGGKQALEHYYKYHYDFEEYLPGYTHEQKAMMLEGLSKLTDEYDNDTELVSILKEYAETLREYPADTKWVNQTAGS